MSYPANVFRVMIASPSDVKEERTAVRAVLAKWNDVHSRSRAIVLLPVGWETHSTPEMGDRPQAIINKQLSDCDLLVGVFGSRIGTPTGTHISGTVEEIEEHIKAGKPVMLYFSTAPIERENLDPDQYAELEKFKESCKTRGLFVDYTDTSDFGAKFYDQIQLKLNEDVYLTSVPEPLSGLSFVATNAVPDMATLSDEAQEMLKEISGDSGGHLSRVEVLGGFLVQSNGREFVGDRDPRKRALWEGAIKELEDLGLIEDRGYNREIFGITREGYRVAELLKPQGNETATVPK